MNRRDFIKNALSLFATASIPFTWPVEKQTGITMGGWFRKSDSDKWEFAVISNPSEQTFFNGKVAGCIFRSRLLSDDEINKLYQQTKVILRRNEP